MLPGGDLVRKGLSDLAAGRESAEALLVAIGADRIRAAGIEVPQVAIAEPEHRLYALLEEEDPSSAHAAYNALVRRLVSFERALEQRRRSGRGRRVPEPGPVAPSPDDREEPDAPGR